MEHTSRVDRKILALRARAQTLDLERKVFIQLVEQLKQEISEYQKSEKQGLPAPAEAKEVAVSSLQTQGTKDEGRSDGDCVPGKAGSDQEDGYQDSEALHRRCWEVIASSTEGSNSQLCHELQKLEQKHKDLVERSEDLESTPGETQIQSKQKKELFESEVEGLQQHVISLEAELLHVQKDNTEMNGDEQALSGAQEMQEMLKSCQETIEKLGTQLGEQRERRKQLASELELLREDLKAEKKGLGSQVSELLQEREQIENLERTHEDLCTDEKRPAEQIKNLSPELPDSNKKREELEKPLKESNEYKQLILDELAQLNQGVLATQEQGGSVLGETLRMNQGLAQGGSRFPVSQSSEGSSDGSIKQALTHERFQQQEEKLQQLRQDLRRVQNLCSSAERELKYEREKNVDFRKQNLLLQEECTKVKAELKQAQAKLLDTTQTCSALTAQWEESQQKVKDLEQELLKCSQADKLQSSLQEKLAQEKSKVCEAQKKISKLQQKLKDSQHQLLLAEARVSDKKLLEEELKEARENEARVQQELHEEQLKRKLPEQQVEMLQQQLRHSRETEASLAKMHVELQAKTLHVLDSERKTDSSEHLQYQKENQKLSEQLALLKEENKALYEEGVRILSQKDLCVRKYNEMQLRHKAKIRRAKETFIHEVKQRDSRIKQLENELSESKLQVEKGKMLVAEATAESEKLLQERRRLLQKITDQEETLWSNRSMIASLQSRVKILDEELMRLHESKLQLSGHAPTSQRTPGSIHASNTEYSKGITSSERRLQSKGLPSPHPSFPPREPQELLSTLKGTQHPKLEGEAETQDSAFRLSPCQPSELGYLNVASPGDTTASQRQEESQRTSSGNF